MSVIILNYQSYITKGGYKVWKSLVSCDCPTHNGDRNRLIFKTHIKKSNSAVICRPCCDKIVGKKLGNHVRSEEERIKLSRVFSEETKDKMKISALNRVKNGWKPKNYNPNREEQNKIRVFTNFVHVSLHRLINKQRDLDISVNDLGYSYLEFIKHIESTWEPWMNWSNHGMYKKNEPNKTWNIDHIKPVSQFIKEGNFNLKEINSLSNLTALDSRQNIVKNAKY